MPGVADHDHFAALVAHLGELDVDLGHEWTSRVEYLEPPLLRLRAHRAGYAVRAEHDGAAARDVGERLDEHGALRAQAVDDEFVMDDLMADVDRRPELGKRVLDDRDGAIHAGAEAARISEQDVHDARGPC